MDPESGVPGGAPPTEPEREPWVDDLADALLIADAAELRISEANAQACELLGYARTALLGRKLPELIDPADLARSPIRYRDLATGRPVILRRVLRTRTGASLPVELRERLVRGNRVVCVVRDLRDRVRAEEQAGRLAAIIESSGDAIIATTADGRITDWNPAAERIFGYGAQDVIGSSARMLVGPCGEDCVPLIRRALEEGGIRDLDIEQTHADGRPVRVQLSLSPIRDRSGRATGVVMVARDTTAENEVRDELRRRDETLAEREAYFRTVLENVSDLITVLDADGRIRYQSPSVRAILGYGPDQLEGRSVFDLVHPEDLDQARERLGGLLAEPAYAAYLPLRFRRRDGRWAVLETRAQNLLDDPLIAGIIINSRDITDRERLEVQLHHAQKMEAIGRLAGGVAHDFNNLITAISGHAFLLDEEIGEQPELRAEVAQIRRAADRASALTRQLLSFSRKEAVSPRLIDLNATILETERLLRRLIGEDVELSTDLEPTLGRVHADPGQMEQVLMNLAVNARDAMPGGGILTVATRTVRLTGGESLHLPAGSYARVDVHDTGTGIDPATLAHIFEPFYTTKAEGKGTGLGLSTVYSIVRQSGGTIDVDSRPGTGTTFRIYLPVAGTAEAGQEDAEPRGAAEDGAAAPAIDATVLLVDDDRAVRTLARRVLERSGCRVLEAETSARALERLADDGGVDVSVVLCDVALPDGDGRELGRRIAYLRPDVQVLYSSGYSTEWLDEDGRAPDRARFLEKPFTADALLRLVRGVLDGDES